LLESKYLPKQGELSISPDLKRNVPLASLAYDKWDMPVVKTEKVTEQRRVTKGWKALSLADSAHTLLNAARRLEQDVQKEKSFWDQILNVKEQGWALFRNPKQRQQLAVNIASSEASLNYKTRGLVPLQLDRDGFLDLNHPVVNNPKMLRVRISRNGLVVATSQPIHPHQLSSLLEPTLQQRLIYARDSIFEEELFFTMAQEARVLLSHGVAVQGRTIHISTAPQSFPQRPDIDHILLDLVSQYENSAMEWHESNSLAQAYALSLRLLLSNFHAKLLRSRSTPPPPLSKRPSSEVSPFILKPVLNMVRHDHAVRRLASLLTNVAWTLKDAGLEVDMKQDAKLGNSPSSPDSSGSSKQKDPSSRINITQFALELPSSSFGRREHRTAPCYLQIAIQTDDQSGDTTFKMVLPQAISERLLHSFGGVRNATSPNIEGLHENLIEYLNIDIFYNLLALQHPSWAADEMEMLLCSSRQEDRKTERMSITVRLAVAEVGRKCQLHITVTPNAKGTEGHAQGGNMMGIVDGLIYDFENKIQS